MMAAPCRNFSVIHEKIMHCRLVCMCPTMDLVASIHADGQLSVHRTMGWQRSFTLTPEDMGNRTFSCITWSPNGKTLAVGFTDGTIQLFGVETGAEECSLEFHEGRSLAALTWVAQQPRQGAARTRDDEEADQLAEVAAAYGDRCEHLLGSSFDQLPGTNGTSGGNGGGIGGCSSDQSSQGEDGFTMLQGMNERPVSILASADASGLVVLSVCGAYRLVTIDLRAHRSSASRASGRGFVGSRVSHAADSAGQRRPRRVSKTGSGVGAGAGAGVGSGPGAGEEGDDGGAGVAVRPLQLTLSSDLSLLSALVEAKGHIELVQVELPLLWSRRHELKPLAMQFTAFRTLIGRLMACVPRLPVMWNGALQTLEAKLGSLEECLKRHGYDKCVTPRDEFMLLVTCGHASDALKQFLSTTMTETHLARVRKTVDAGTGQVESMLRGNVLFLARTLLFRASDLQRLALGCNGDGRAEEDSELGLGPELVEAFLRDCEMLCLKVEHALREVQVCRSRLRFLLAWLEQILPFVTGSAPADGAEDQREPPSLPLASSVLSILREPLPTDDVESDAPQLPARRAPRSKVESTIGASVPSLLANAGSDEGTLPLGEHERWAKPPEPALEGVAALLPGDSALWSRTLGEQVQRLQTSVAEVFQAPRSRLTRAVGKPTCARICSVSEGSASDPVRTRAATRAAVAAAVDPPHLVSMRACMGFQEKLPVSLAGIERSRWGDFGGIAAATVSPDGGRNSKGEDVVWVLLFPVPVTRASPSEGEEDDGSGVDRMPVYVTGIRSPPDFRVRQVAFYGSVPGVPSQNEVRLAILLEPMGDVGDESSVLHLLALDDLNFSEIGPLSAFNSDRFGAAPRMGRGAAAAASAAAGASGVAAGGGRGGGGGGGGLRDVANVARARGVDTPLLSNLSSRSRAMPKHVKGVTVALSGARGMACAVSASKHLMVFDLEEDEEDDEEEEEDEVEEEDGDGDTDGRGDEHEETGGCAS